VMCKKSGVGCLGGGGGEECRIFYSCKDSNCTESYGGNPCCKPSSGRGTVLQKEKEWRNPYEETLFKNSEREASSIVDSGRKRGESVLRVEREGNPSGVCPNRDACPEQKTLPL